MVPSLTFILTISAIVSLICLLSIAFLHFAVHFQLRSCQKQISHRSTTRLPPTKKVVISDNNTPISSSPERDNNIAMIMQIPPQIPHSSDSSCRFCIAPVDEETFEFYPVSFVCYLLLSISLTGFILYKLIKTDTIFHDDFGGNLSDLIPIHKYRQKYLLSMHLSLGDYHLHDWILIYSQIILSLWDSIFSFYRYYTTMHCANYFQLASLETTLKYFSIYGIPYLALSVLQIHAYYFLFPLIMMAHLTMNIWCNWMFAKILIDSTMQYAKTEQFSDNMAIHDDMLKSVYFMRRTSIIWCCISFVCHSLFITTYNVDILCLYPLLWCIGSMLFALNFVRNRSRIYEESFKIFRAMKHCSFATICAVNEQRNNKENCSVISSPNPSSWSSPNDETKAGSGTNDENNMESTAKSTEIKSGAHHMMHSADEEDQIGEIDVFEDEDEMMIYEYCDDPIALMALNKCVLTESAPITKTVRPRSNTLNRNMHKMNQQQQKKRESTSFVYNQYKIGNVPNTASSSSDPMDRFAKTNANNKRQHQLMPTMILSDVTEQIDLYQGDDDDDEIILELEEEEEGDKKRGNKALELLGLAPNISHVSNSQMPSVKQLELRRKIRSVSGSQTDLPSTATIFGHRRSQSMGSPNVTFDDKKVQVIIDEIDEIKEEEEEEESLNNEMISEITQKLQLMMQRKSEVNPTIVRRLDYETKLASRQAAKKHDGKARLKRSASAPNSPRRIAQYFGFAARQKNDEKSNQLLNIPMLNEKKLTLKRTGSVPLNSNSSAAKAADLLRVNTNQNKSLRLMDNKSCPGAAPKEEQLVENKQRSRRKMKQKSAQDTLVFGFNALVLQGFYSRKSLNSVQQLTQLKQMQNKKFLSSIKE